MATEPKIHLVLHGNALCDFQACNGGRLACYDHKVFSNLPADCRCRECAGKLLKIIGKQNERAAKRNAVSRERN
jgi:hypothetical protein